MLSVDTNILLYAHDSQCPEHQAALGFLRHQASNPDFAICELVLVELYMLLRNPVILTRPLLPAEAVKVVQTFRANRYWSVIECAEGVMSQVWDLATRREFPRRMIFDARLALTLRRCGVTAFATHNPTHFAGFGFDKVWDPIAAPPLALP